MSKGWSEQVKVGLIEEMPPWLLDSKFLLTGHRFPQSFKSLSISLFTKHNQTMNIWTHLLGAFFFCWVVFWIFTASLMADNIANTLKENLISYQFENHFEKFSSSFLSPIFENFHHESLDDFKDKYTEAMTNFNSIVPFPLSIQPHFETFQKVIREEAVFAMKSTNSSEFILKCHQPSIFFENLVVHSSKLIELFPVYVFAASAIVCLLCSSIYHLYSPLSPFWFRVLRKMDYSGICLNIPSSTFAYLYYLFYCHDTLRNVYVYGMFTIGIVVFIFNNLPLFEARKFKPIRVTLFAILGFSNVIPVVHGMYFSLFSSPESYILPLGKHTVYHIAQLFCYLIGIFFYVSHFPEKHFPKKFDIWLNSHTIWHVCVFLGMYCCWMAIWHTLVARLEIRCGYCQ